MTSLGVKRLFTLTSYKATFILKQLLGNSLAVQWLGLGVFIAEDLGSIPGRGPKILQATWCMRPKKKKKKSLLEEHYLLNGN